MTIIGIVGTDLQARVNPAFLEDLRNEVNLYMIPIQEPKHTKQK